MLSSTWRPRSRKKALSISFFSTLSSISCGYISLYDLKNSSSLRAIKSSMNLNTCRRFLAIYYYQWMSDWKYNDWRQSTTDFLLIERKDIWYISHKIGKGGGFLLNILCKKAYTEHIYRILRKFGTRTNIVHNLIESNIQNNRRQN